MSRLLTIISYELRRNVQRKSYLFTTFGVPIVALLLLLGYHGYQVTIAAAPDEDTTTEEETPFEGIDAVGLVDLSGALDDDPFLLRNLLQRYDDVESARAALNDDTIDVFYVVQEDFPETGEVVTHVPGLQTTLFTNRVMESLFFTNLAPDVDASLVERLQDPASFEVFDVSRTATAADAQTRNEDADLTVIYVFSLAMVGGLFLTNNYLMQSVIEEKENKLIEILLSSVTPRQLLTGKTLALSMLGLLQLMVWAIGAYGIFQLARTLSTYEVLSLVQAISIPAGILPLMGVYFLLAYLLYAAIFSGIGALSGSMREGPQYSGIVVVIAMMPFYFVPLFIETPDAVLPVALSYIPFTAPIAMLMRWIIATVPAWQVALSVGLLLLTTLGALWLSARLFRVQLLLRGNSPTLRDIPALLFSDDVTVPQTGNTA